MKRDSSSLLLMEMALAILFFALSAAVILQVFVGAHRNSVNSETVTSAVFLSEDAVNALRASEGSAEDFFAGDGYVKTESGYEKETELNGRKYIISFTGQEHYGSAGTLFSGEVSVLYDGNIMHSMQAARFRPGEVFP